MFSLSEMAIESILRTGWEEIKSSSDIDLAMQDIFGRLSDSFLTQKYSGIVGDIKSKLNLDEMNFIHALSQLERTKFPAFSIHLLQDMEAENKTAFYDLEGKSEISIDSVEIVSSFDSSSYNSENGRISIPDSVSLSKVYANSFYVDGNGSEFRVRHPISNDVGDKFITIDQGIIGLNLTGNKVVSSIKSRVFDHKYIPTDEKIMVGVHTENALLTRFYYYILRYLLYKSKDKMQDYGLLLAKFSGSDFSMAETLLPNNVYSRFITLDFVAYNSWHDNELDVIDVLNPFGGMICLTGEFKPVSYDDVTGIVTVPNDVNLSEVIENYIFVDADNNKFIITGGIDNNTHQFNIGAGKIVSIEDGACVKIPHKIHADANTDREDYEDYSWDTTVPEWQED